MAELDEIIEQPSEVEKRIKTLSEKVRLTSEERDEMKRLSEEKDTKLSEKDREISFLSGFSDVLSTNPAAKDHKDEIKAKVMAGYSVEDAAFAVLGKAGKLGQPKIEETNIAGGSATNALQQTGDKSINEMTQAERRAALMEREADLQNILSPRSQN